MLLSAIFFKFIRCLLLIKFLCCSSSASQRRRTIISSECLHGGKTEADGILSLFDSLVANGPSSSLLSKLSMAFKTRNNHAQIGRNQTECETKAFLSIDDNFNRMEITIKSLHAHGDLKKSLIEARQTLNKVRAVFIALDIYDRQNEVGSLRDAVNQCNLNHPRNSLIALQGQVTTTPYLFEEILAGTRYSQTDFDKMSSVWMKQAGFCVLLMQACDKLQDANASTALQNVRRNYATSMLQDIHLMLLEAQKKLKEDFKIVVVDDILTTLREIDNQGKTRTQGVEMIHNQLSNKFHFREWAVMIYDRVDSGDTSVHAHEGSTDNWFMVNDAHHTVVAHSADKDKNCSFFEDNFRHNITLKDFFNTTADFVNFVNSNHYGHLGNTISTLKQIFATHKLPQIYFFSVIEHQPSLAVKRGKHFHYFEHVRLSRMKPAMKSVLIGWC